MSRPILGPTFEEMLHPSTIDPATRQKAVKTLKEAPLDPVNLYNLSWRGAKNRIKYEILPRELTGVDAPIVVLYGRDFPSGSHKVGAAYSVLAEELLFGRVDIDRHTVVWPSTGNYGIGGAWVTDPARLLDRHPHHKVRNQLQCCSLPVLPHIQHHGTEVSQDWIAGLKRVLRSPDHDSQSPIGSNLRAAGDGRVKHLHPSCFGPVGNGAGHLWIDTARVNEDQARMAPLQHAH